MKPKPPRVRIVLEMVVLLLAAVKVEGTISLQIDYRYDSSGFFAAGTEARSCLSAVGDFYNALLDDDLTAINSDSWNQFDLQFARPDTGVDVTISDFDVPANTLVVFVGARDLGETVRGQGGPGGWNASYHTASWLTNVITRGESTVTTDIEGPTAIDVAPWGGTLAVDSNATWHYDHTRNPGYSNDDLYSVLVHEMGHVLGFGNAYSWRNKINANNYFTGSKSIAEYGGNVPLATSGSHWANGLTSTLYADGPAQQAAMTPAITVGTRKRLTDVDAAGLDDLGWTLHPVSLWKTSGGGAFATNSNWSTGARPTARDTAEFALAGAYAVTFTADQLCQQAEVKNGDVTFNLGTKTLTVDDLIVSTAGASLQVSNGTLRLVGQGIVETNATLSIGTGGFLQLDGGLHGSVALEAGGTLTGEGYVAKTVVNGGQLKPGDAAGTLVIDQNYVQQSAGSLAIELGGLARGASYDWLDIAGLATLNGALQVSLTGGFLPGAGDSFEIMTYGSRSGVFSSLSGNTLSNGLTLAPDYDSTSLALVATILGDANFDGTVNDADATILASHWRLANGALWTYGDFNGDGAVNDRDASIMAAHWGQEAEGLRTVVPEPSCRVCLVSAVLCASLLFHVGRHGR